MWENVGFENYSGRVSLIWQCKKCSYETDGGLEEPKSMCPVCHCIENHLPIFAIAYKDEYGEDYAENEPFVYDVGDRETAKINAQRMIKAGFSDVTVFQYNRDYAVSDTHLVTWDFVHAHQVT